MEFRSSRSYRSADDTIKVFFSNHPSHLSPLTSHLIKEAYGLRPKKRG